MRTYVKSRGSSRLHEYLWINEDHQENEPSIINQSFQIASDGNKEVRITDFHGLTDPAIIVLRKGQNLLILLTGIKAEWNAPGGAVYHSVVWLSDEEKVVRELVIYALKGRLQDNIASAITSSVNKLGFQVDFDRLNRFDFDEDLILKEDEASKVDISVKNNQELKDKLAIELTKKRLPEDDGFLVVVSDFVSEPFLKDVKAWRGLTSRSERYGWDEGLPKKKSDIDSPPKLSTNSGSAEQFNDATESGSGIRQGNSTTEEDGSGADAICDGNASGGDNRVDDSLLISGGEASCTPSEPTNPGEADFQQIQSGFPTEPTVPRESSSQSNESIVLSSNGAEPTISSEKPPLLTRIHDSMSPLSSNRRDEIIKILEFRYFVEENHLKGQSAFLLLKSVEEILKNYSSLIDQKIRLDIAISESRSLNDYNLHKWLIEDRNLVCEGMKKLPPDEQDRLIKIADVLREVSTDSLLKEVEKIIDSYLAELRDTWQRLQQPSVDGLNRVNGE